MADVVFTLPPLSGTGVLRPLFMQAAFGDPVINYNAEDFRLLLGAVFTRPGRVGGGNSFWVEQRTAGGPGLAVDVNIGQAVVGNSATEHDRYLVHNYTKRTLTFNTFSTTPAATRTHKVWLAVYDKNISGNLYEARLAVTEDTGTGAPNPPDNPSYLLELARFTISNGQTTVTNAHITNLPTRGQFGTGSTDITMGAGASPNPNSYARWSISGNTIRFSGGIVRTGGTAFTAGTSYPSIASVPAYIAPRFARHMIGTTGGGTNPHAYRLSVGTDGVLDAVTFTGNAPTTLYLDGITYEID